MEIIHVVLFVLIMVGVYYLKTRLPTQILFPLSLFIGIAMLIWFWVFWEREIPGRILITVLVLSGLYKYLENRKQKRWENWFFQGRIPAGLFKLWIYEFTTVSPDFFVDNNLRHCLYCCLPFGYWFYIYARTGKLGLFATLSDSLFELPGRQAKWAGNSVWKSSKDIQG